MNIVANSPTLGDTQFFQLPKRLTEIFSPTEAMVLQQLHSYLRKNYGKVIDGVRWIYNTYEQWQSVFPGLTARQIRYAFKKLREWDVVVVEQLEKHDICGTRRNWYTLDYEVLNSLLSRFFSGASDSSVRPSDKSVGSGDKSVASSIYTENTYKKITAETEQPTAAAISVEPSVCVSPFGSPHTEVYPSLGYTEDAVISHHKGLINPTSHIEIQGARDNSLQNTVDMVEVRDKNKEEEEKQKLQEQQEQQSKIEAIDSVDIKLSPQLKSLVREFAVDEVFKAVEHYSKAKPKKVIENPAGWLLDCLRGKWWKSEEKTTQQRSAPKQNQSQPVVIAPVAVVSVTEAQNKGETLDTEEQKRKAVLRAIFEAVNESKVAQDELFIEVRFSKTGVDGEDVVELNGSGVFPRKNDKTAKLIDLAQDAAIFEHLKRTLKECWDDSIKLAREAHPDIWLPSLRSGEYI